MKLNRIGLWMGIAIFAAGCNNAGYTSDTYHQGLKYYNEQRFADAAGAFRASVRNEPREYHAQYYLGASLDALGEYQKALQAYKAAFDVMETTESGSKDTAFRSKVMDAIAVDVARSDDRDKEIQLVRDRAKANNNALDYVLLARIYRHLGDPDSAIAAYKSATLTAPDDKAIHQEFGTYLTQVGLKHQAAEELQRAK